MEARGLMSGRIWIAVHGVGLRPRSLRLSAWRVSIHGLRLGNGVERLRAGAVGQRDHRVEHCASSISPDRRPPSRRPFALAGWTFDRAAPTGTGVDTIHVWAFPAAGGSPSFVGVPAYGASRPDVGGYFGTRFTPSGYNMAISSLAPGTYDLVVFSHSVVTNSFDAAQVVRVTVQ